MISPHNPPEVVAVADDEEYCRVVNGLGIVAAGLEGRMYAVEGVVMNPEDDDEDEEDGFGLVGGDNQPLVIVVVVVVVVVVTPLTLDSLSLPLASLAASLVGPPSSSVTSLLNGLDLLTGELPPELTLDLAKYGRGGLRVMVLMPMMLSLSLLLLSPSASSL